MSSGFVFAHTTFSLLVFLLLPTRRLSRRTQALVLLACGGLGFVTIDGLSLGDYTRSYTDDLAITTLLWLAWCVVSRMKVGQPLSSRHHLQFALCFAGLALFLYPATLGLSQIDPYRLGFSPLLLLAAMWVLCVWLWMEGNRLTFALIACATVSFMVSVKDSNNYWDYLVDPILGVYCIAHLVARLQQLLRQKISLSFIRKPLEQNA